MAESNVRGRFVWHELLTGDAASAHSFYTKVLGWKSQAWDLDPSYTMFLAASGPLGGTAESSDGNRWLTYVRTDDIDATVEKARGLGATVKKDITDMPNGGKYAVLTDPQGAEFGVYLSASAPEPEGPAKRGEASWHELATTDYKAAFEFYSELFGWEAASEHDMGEPLGVYLTFSRNGQEIGGIFNRTPDMPAPFWLPYVRVKDVQQAVKKVQSAGGTLIAGPMEVPGGDWIAQFTDPQGAVFAVHTFAADIKQVAETQPVPPPVAETEPEAEAAPTNEPEEAVAEMESSDSAAKPAAKKARKSSKSAAKAAKKSAAKTAKKSAKKAAKKSAKKSAKKAAKKSAKKSGKKVAKRAAKKKTSKATKKRGAATRRAKRPARKTATAKATAKKRSGGKKKAAKRPRKAK